MITSNSDNKTTVRSSDIKLQEEKRRLVLLQESLTRSNALTSGMVSTLDSFERKLQSLDDLVTPVYEATNELSLLLNNVDQSLTLLDSVLHYYDICGELTPTVSSGPGGNLSDYLSELDRLEEAVKYFKRSTAAVERERVTQLYELGRKRLVDETDKLILRYANPLSGKELMELCELSANSTKDIHLMQEEDMATLRSIIDWFGSHGFRQGLIDSYSTKRATMIRRSLQHLAEHMVRTTVRRVSVNYAALSPNMAQLNASGGDGLKRQGRKIGDMGRRLIRTSISGPSIPGGAKSPIPAHLCVNDDSGSFESSDDRDTSNYQVLLDAFIVLLRRDRDLLNYVFPLDLQTLVFAKLIELPLVYMREEAQRLCESVERLPKKIDAGKSAIFGIFAILRWFLKSRPTFAKLFQESDDTRRQQFTTLSATFEKAAANYLRAIREEIINDTSPLSQGGNVHPLTSHVLAFMEGLLAYEDTATIIASLYTRNESGTNSNAPTGNEKGLLDLATYFAQLIRVLHDSLFKKLDNTASRTDVVIRSVFLLNNVNYLLKRLENSPLLTIIQRSQPDLKTKYENDLQTSLRDFTKCYTPLILAIQEMLEYDNNNRLPETRLRDREREKLKESFTAVNNAIDNIRQQCEQYIVSDIVLRDRLRNESKTLLLDLFQRYYNKFANKDFTKNREKYIRYDPKTLGTMIDNFFEHRS